MYPRNAIALSCCLLLTGGCATVPPRRVENACGLLAERPAWYRAARATEQKWGVPVQIQLAIMRRESSFQEDARPPRVTFLGIPLWWRRSSAYGYAQAKDETWDWYRQKSGNGWADRDDFADAADFIGWYVDVSQRTLGISKWDAYNQYLAFHEGHDGWKRKTYADKPWLVQAARQVDEYARGYGAQLRGCRERLEGS